MKKPLSIMLVALCALTPSRAIAQSTLDEMSTQLESSNSFAPGAGGRPTITLEELRATQAEETRARIDPPDYRVPSTAGPRPNVLGTVSDGISNTVDTSRFIDPVTGRISGAVDGISSRFNSAIDRVLNGFLSPIDGAIDGVFDRADVAIDQAIANIMSPVDDAIDSIMASIDGYIDDLIGGLFEQDGAVGGILDEATGGIFGGIFGGGGRNKVEPQYNPNSPLSSIVSATSFQTGLVGITAPYTDALPIPTGDMGLPDYSMIMPTLDALAVGENGHANKALQGADRFNTAPEALKQSLSGEIERLGSRSIAYGTLSAGGQTEMKADKDGADETLKTIIKLGDDSQDMDVTQDVMKNLTAQLANDSVIRVGQYKQDMQSRQQAAADAIVNAEIAQLLSEQNRAERASKAGSAAGLHVATGQLHLPGEMSDEDRLDRSKRANNAPIFNRSDE